MSTKRYNVLTLEDSSLDFEIIRNKLTQAGYDIDMLRAENKEEFTRLITTRKFDLILSDFKLVGFDGFEALRVAKEVCPDVPFICVSGYIGEETAIELLKHGAVDYVLKDKLDRLPFAVNRAMEEAREINSRREAENALQESEARLSDIIFSMADWVWEVDAHGIYTYSSQKGMELLDVTREDILGKTPFDFMPPEEAERIREIFGRIIANKEPIRDLENWNIGKHGKKICLLTNGVPILDENGNLKGYRGVDKDITEKRLAVEALRLSEANLAYAQEIARMGNWDSDLVTGQYSWSRNMYSMLGIDPDSVTIDYEFFLSLVHPEDRHLITENMDVILETKAPVSFDFRYELPDGRVLWVQNNIYPVFADDQLIELHGTNIDQTEKKEVEQELIKAKEKAEASDTLKSAFINNISHEVRTPLNGIIGFSEMLLNPEISSENKIIFHDIIKKSSSRLLKTITSYMDISMIVSGNVDVFEKTVSLNTLFDELKMEYQEACTEKGLELIVEKPLIPSNVQLHSDPDILRKIFTHLLDNALKFTSKGSIRFGFRKNGDKLEFYVTDTGIGIEKEKIRVIFENFMQADTSLTRGYEGSGLGLSIANGLVRLLNGELIAESEFRSGSTFIFTIPSSVILPATSQKHELRIQPPPALNPLILVAEDDEFNFKFIEIVLKRADFKVVRAENGAEAVKICKENSDVSIVLMDLKMPIMGGIEATKKIKSFLPDLPIIALTAYVSSTDEYEALLSGCDEFMPKPINRNKLIELINKILGR